MTTGNIDVIFENMKYRRVTRAFTSEPVTDEALFQVAQAGRFAASGGNLRPHRFFITRDPQRIGLVRSFSPGMLAYPPAIIAILIDHEQYQRQWVSIDPSMIIYADVGTAAQNMLNMAHALGLGSCPVSSFSKSGVREALGLPAHVSVEMLILLGHPEDVERQVNPNAPKPVTTRELTSWETFGKHAPG
ncbi:nitroreductase [soil metagenome]